MGLLSPCIHDPSLGGHIGWLSPASWCGNCGWVEAWRRCAAQSLERVWSFTACQWSSALVALQGLPAWVPHSRLAGFLWLMSEV